MTETGSLSLELRRGTADAHREAEGSAFVERFTSGTLDRATHARHLRALHPVYEALEDGLTRHRRDPRIGDFFLPQLWRTAVLERDLLFLLGDGWRDLPPVPGALRYGDRLRRLAAETPLLLVSHAYVRYLGDLSGGQVLRRLAARTLDLEDDGLRFYDFPEVDRPGACKDDFRRRLDRLELDGDERRSIVEEARIAFRLNATIFAELAPGDPPPTAGT